MTTPSQSGHSRIPSSASVASRSLLAQPNNSTVGHSQGILRPPSVDARHSHSQPNHSTAKLSTQYDTPSNMTQPSFTTVVSRPTKSSSGYVSIPHKTSTVMFHPSTRHSVHSNSPESHAPNSSYHTQPLNTSQGMRHSSSRSSSPVEDTRNTSPGMWHSSSRSASPLEDTKVFSYSYPSHHTQPLNTFQGMQHSSSRSSSPGEGTRVSSHHSRHSGLPNTSQGMRHSSSRSPSPGEAARYSSPSQPNRHIIKLNSSPGRHNSSSRSPSPPVACRLSTHSQPSRHLGESYTTKGMRHSSKRYKYPSVVTRSSKSQPSRYFEVPNSPQEVHQVNSPCVYKTSSLESQYLQQAAAPNSQRVSPRTSPVTHNYIGQGFYTVPSRKTHAKRHSRRSSSVSHNQHPTYPDIPYYHEGQRLNHSSIGIPQSVIMQSSSSVLNKSDN